LYKALACRYSVTVLPAIFRVPLESVSSEKRQKCHSTLDTKDLQIMSLIYDTMVIHSPNVVKFFAAVVVINRKSTARNRANRCCIVYWIVVRWKYF
jgi:hypothetical protein